MWNLGSKQGWPHARLVTYFLVSQVPTSQLFVITFVYLESFIISQEITHKEAKNVVQRHTTILQKTSLLLFNCFQRWCFVTFLAKFTMKTEELHDLGGSQKNHIKFTFSLICCHRAFIGLVTFQFHASDSLRMLSPKFEPLEFHCLCSTAPGVILSVWPGER